MKKICILLITLFVFLLNNNIVKAKDYCTKETAAQLAKIVYKEVGADTAKNKDETFFMRLNTAAIVINNANNKKGNTFYEKIYNLTDGNYENYSSYKDKSFESIVPSSRRGELLYIAELVLAGKYTFPTNMTLQASEEIVTQYGDVWATVSSISGFYDMYFGYEHNKLNDKDIYGNKITDTSVNAYKNLANSLKLKDYSAYTLNTVCSGTSNSVSNTNNNSNTNTSNESTSSEVCSNPDILKVIYFGLIIIDIVKIIIPIALIVLGIIDFSKAVIISDEKVQKKSVNLFLKRLLYAVLVFAVPWIIKVFMITLGDLLGGEQINFTDCLDNANSECIEALENGTELDKCDLPSSYGNTCYMCYEKDGNYNKLTYIWGYNIENTPFKQCQNVPAVTEEKQCLDKNNDIKYCYYCSTTDEFKYGSKPSNKCDSNSGWEIVYTRDESHCNNNNVNDNTYKCYFCSVSKQYEWSINKPNDVCISASGWEIDYNINDERMCRIKKQ